VNRDSDVLWILCSAAGRPRPSCRRRARAPDHTYCVMAVRMSPDSTIAVRFVFDNMSTENRAFAARPQCGVRTTPVRGLCNDRNDMSTGYGLTIFENLYNFFITNRRGCDARESVRKSHGSRLPSHGKGDRPRAVCGFRIETHRNPNVNYRPKRFKPPTPGPMLLSYGALGWVHIFYCILTFFGFRRRDRRTPDNIVTCRL